jgi:hypothetical protein
VTGRAVKRLDATHVVAQDPVPAPCPQSDSQKAHRGAMDEKIWRQSQKPVPAADAPLAEPMGRPHGMRGPFVQTRGDRPVRPCVKIRASLTTPGMGNGQWDHRHAVPGCQTGTAHACRKGALHAVTRRSGPRRNRSAGAGRSRADRSSRRYARGRHDAAAGSCRDFPARRSGCPQFRRYRRNRPEAR